MNFRVSQYKNFWKWGHMTFVCQIHSSKCQKYNILYKLEYYKEIVLCCKINFKTNLPRLKTKKEKPCTHTFKCINCKGEHQVDSNTCLFWKHRFNKDWYNKKS